MGWTRPEKQCLMGLSLRLRRHSQNKNIHVEQWPRSIMRLFAKRIRHIQSSECDSWPVSFIKSNVSKLEGNASTLP